jgi:hypothetical protein
MFNSHVKLPEGGWFFNKWMVLFQIPWKIGFT